MGEEKRERRQHERVDVVAEVSLHHGGKVYQLPVGNVSAGGIYLQLAFGQIPGVELGQTVVVRCDFGPDDYGDDVDIQAEAEVVRIDLGLGVGHQPGIALMWSSKDPWVAEQLYYVLTHLERQSGGR